MRRFSPLIFFHCFILRHRLHIIFLFARIIKSSDQQSSIFLQQKLIKVADLDERAKIVDAICTRGFEMMAHRYQQLLLTFRT